MLVSSVQGAETAQVTQKATADTQKAASTSVTQTYYFSPALVIDPKAGTDVLEYRNTSTGAVINQYPSEKDIKAYTQNSVKPPVATQPVVQADSKVASTASTGSTAASGAQSTTAIIV
jgi:hypothetical protein